MSRSVAQTIWHWIRPTVNRAGVDMVRIDRYPFASHLPRLGITFIFDVGANVGQFGELVRRSGYTGSILSLEPVESAFWSLARKARDPKWKIAQFGLGELDGKCDIRVSRHTEMSSFRSVNETFAQKFPWSSVDHVETVTTTRLDSIFASAVSAEDRVLLKIDVQGTEDQVLAGAQASLPKVAAVQVEMSTASIYGGERLMAEQMSFLSAHGFQLVDLAPVFRDHDGRLVQVDGFFERLP